MHISMIVVTVERTLILAALPATFSLIVFLVLKSAKWITGREVSNASLLSWVACVFGTLALVIGMLTAASRSAAIGQVVPATLGLIGAVALFVITKPQAEISVPAAAVIAFSLFLLFGAYLGSYERGIAENYQELRRNDPFKLKAKVDLEFVINGYRRSLGLAPTTFAQ